ncbi:hypothetical protein O0I10_002816 [Lichtheimia ornata]|uniref:Uncharacterized protein n=1 Tax=Lichtheimia ornata TaxID=688661 RepID=A0AAD7XY66_9FUNG|nr:uncharacterized protein O0I10_002816 [Lichtheimia ornata]KAJ8661549.1 hypothetical protein O0I10_002816 [Lichtheimia ornata]
MVVYSTTFDEHIQQLDVFHDENDYDGGLRMIATITMHITKIVNNVPNAETVAATQLLVTVLVFGNPSHLGLLWEQHSSSLCGDYQWHYIGNEMDVDIDRCVAEALKDIQRLLEQHNEALESFHGMPSLPDSSIFMQQLPIQRQVDDSSTSTGRVTHQDSEDRVAALNIQQRTPK